MVTGPGSWSRSGGFWRWFPQPGHHRPGVHFFQVFPMCPWAFPEVHLILGSTLFLLFGMAPTDCTGLLLQGLLFRAVRPAAIRYERHHLVGPLFGLQYVAGRVIAPNTPLRPVAVPAGPGAVDHLSSRHRHLVGFWAPLRSGCHRPDRAEHRGIRCGLPDRDHRRATGRPHGPGRRQSLRQFKDSALLNGDCSTRLIPRFIEVGRHHPPRRRSTFGRKHRSSNVTHRTPAGC